ncbi:hypothetical protein LINPERHAP1_LOCUS23514 [Linum perenne]
MVVHSRAKVLVCVTMSLVLFVALSSEILMADQEVVHLSKYDDEHQKVKNEIDHRNHGEEEDLKQVKFRVHGSVKGEELGTNNHEHRKVEDEIVYKHGEEDLKQMKIVARPSSSRQAPHKSPPPPLPPPPPPPSPYPPHL